jgi:hypothetical protein
VVSSLLYRLENSPGTNWTGGWVDPVSDLDVVPKRKIFTDAGNKISVIQPVALNFNELS